MRALAAHLRVAMRLGWRNRLALLYGYLFPVIFLLSFLVLYRIENPPLIRHMGELLTIGLLGGACFGLPTMLVSERERGVWRRYQMTPVSTGSLVASTLAARYVTLISALLLQLLLAMAIGRWTPAHPVNLLVAASLVAVAFMGLGLVIAALADTVPAVQALGQCVFLPMLILGGVAIQPENLPDWVLPITAFFPGRYAVETIQASVNGDGLLRSGFPIAALVVIGAAAVLAGVKLFRWDAGKRRLSLPNKSWIALALGSWILVGVLAIQRNELTPERRAAVPAARATGPLVSPIGRVTREAVGRDQTVTVPNTHPPPVPASVQAQAPAAAAPAERTGAPSTTSSAEGWRALTRFDFAALAAQEVPPDDGDVSPVAPDGQAPVGSSAQIFTRVTSALPKWAPGHVANRAQRVRNYLLLLGVADFSQSPVERFLPAAMLEHLLTEFNPEELAQLVCWVALHTDEGDLSALSDPVLVDLGAKSVDREEVRTRTYYYGVKLMRRLLGG